MTLRDIESWQALPIEASVERVRTGAPDAKSRSRWVPDASLTPADLYCYLRARFGKPNGFVMLAVPPSSDNVIHWHYTVVSDDERLELQGISARIQFMASTNEPLSDKDWRELVHRLKADFSRYGTGMKEVRKSLERWTVFVNPYYRLERIVAEFHARLEDLDIESQKLPDLPRREEEFKKWGELIGDLQQKYSEAALIGTALRMISPVWAESFVNLIIFLLAKEDVRSNNRLYEDLLRKEIDVRVAALHLHCEGFLAPLDRSSEAVKDFLAVMNSRNDFLHGNVDPKRLAVDEIFFDGLMPLFKRQQTFAERGLVPQLKYVEPEAAKQDIYRVEAFIAYVLDLLEPPVRKQVTVFMENQLPGWRQDTGRPGILFSAAVVDLIMPE
ncbi:MAG TPA: hypothetical protein VNW71_14560 [Thermoanaerobaculia bacterium]|nr:hypothetical protein [Thermoanaerobaculia bacterium]